MGQGTGSTKQVSTTVLPNWQEEQAKFALGESRKLYDQNNPTFFPGSTVAGPDPNEITGREYLQDRAGALGNFLHYNSDNPAASGPAYQSLLFGLKAADVANNPYAQGAAQAAIEPVMRNLKEVTLPSLRQGQIGAGAFGGSRGALMEGKAIGDAAQNAMNTTANMYQQMYGQGLQTQMQSLGMIPQLQQATFEPGNVLAATGAQQRAFEQAKIDEDIARYNFEQGVPYTKLTEFTNAVNRPYGGVGASEIQAVAPGGANQTLGAALTGLGLAPSVINWFRGLLGGG